MGLETDVRPSPPLGQFITNTNFFNDSSPSSAFNLAPNSYNVYSGSTGGTQVFLPTNPPTGSIVIVKSLMGSGAGSHPVLQVVPASPSTIEGSIGLNLRSDSLPVVANNIQCILMYDGSNWVILELSPPMLPLALNCGGFSGTLAPSKTILLPRTTQGVTTSGANTFNETLASGSPLLLPSGFSNIDIGINTPTFSAGTLYLVAAVICISQAPNGATNAPNRLVLKIPAGSLPISLPSASSCSPGNNGIPFLDAWTASESTGTDLALNPLTNAQSISSTAGLQYFYTITIQLRTLALVP